MRAVVMDKIAAPLEVREVADPIAPAGGVVIRVLATGLCRSDWHAWAGHEDIAVPHVPGHEFAGVVESVGTGVGRWQPGDRVTAPFVEGCGRCEWCRSGNAQICPDQEQPGFTHWGSFAEFVVVHAADTNLVAIPAGVSMEAAASLGCRFATAYRAVTARAQVRAGEWVTVVGAGGVGLSAVMVTTSLGARVIAVDPLAGALAAASAAGAEHTVSTAEADVPTLIHQLTGGGSDVAIDAVGNEQACATAILSLRRRGRHVQVGLLPPVDGYPRVPLDRAIAWELDLFGSHGMSAADYPPMLASIESGRLHPQDLIEQVVGLDEAAELLPKMDSSTPSGITIISPTR